MTQAFNLSQFANFVNSSGKADLTTAVTGTLPVANGGTGAVTFTSGSVLLGSGTSSFGTVAPGASGNILTSNGTAWTSSAASISGQNIVRFITSGSWTVPAGVSKAIVTVYGNGGTGALSGSNGAFGGFGGYALAAVTGLSGTITITITTAGSGANVTSFGSYVSATGGTNAIANPGSLPTPGTNGAGTVSTGTAIVTGACGNTGYGLYDEESWEAFFYRPGILSGTNYGRAGLVNYYYGTTYAAGAGAVVIQY